MIFIFPAILLLTVIIFFCSLIGFVVCYAMAVLKIKTPDAKDYANTGTKYFVAFIMSGLFLYVLLEMSFSTS